MKNSIEAIWKEGFLSETSLVVPKINDLYNRKSMHVVDKMKRVFKINLMILIISSVVTLIVYYFLDVIWQGVAASILLLLTAWYNKRQIDSLKTLDQGATSLDYLKSLDRWLKDILSKSERLIRFSYPLYLLIAMSTMWSTWNKQEELILKTHQKFPGLIFIGDTPLFALILAGVAMLLMFYFSDKIYKWDLRLMYGGVFSKLEETIAEMEALKQG